MAKAKKIPLIEDFNHIPVESLVPEEEQPYPLPEHWKWVRLKWLWGVRIVFWTVLDYRLVVVSVLFYG